MSQHESAAGVHEPQETLNPDVSVLAGRIIAMMLEHTRVTVGLTGPGRSAVVRRLSSRLFGTVVLSMDDFRLPGAVLRRRGQVPRAHALELLDLQGCAALMDRIRTPPFHVVYAPKLPFGSADPVAAAVAIPATTRIVLLEGDHLLEPTAELATLRGSLDETWDVALDRGLHVGQPVPSAAQTRVVVARSLHNGCSCRRSRLMPRL